MHKFLRNARVAGRAVAFGATAAGVLVLVAACEDAPTAPLLIRQAANGTLWAAIAVPQGTPDAATWLPFVEPGERDSAARSAVLDRLREARVHREQGAIAAALAAEADAAERAAAAVTRAPPPPLLLGTASALDRWADRAEEELAGSGLPISADAAGRVRVHAAAARRAMASGDTAAAVLQLDAGGRVLRAHAPEAVAVQVLTQAEQLLQAAKLPPANRRRAERLLHNARAGLAAGDGGKALHRALYALQLASGVRPGPDSARTPPPARP